MNGAQNNCIIAFNGVFLCADSKPQGFPRILFILLNIENPASVSLFFKDFIFRERGREGEREGEK